MDQRAVYFGTWVLGALISTGLGMGAVMSVQSQIRQPYTPRLLVEDAIAAEPPTVSSVASSSLATAQSTPVFAEPLAVDTTVTLASRPTMSAPIPTAPAGTPTSPAISPASSPATIAESTTVGPTTRPTTRVTTRPTTQATTRPTTRPTTRVATLPTTRVTTRKPSATRVIVAPGPISARTPSTRGTVATAPSAPPDIGSAATPVQPTPPPTPQTAPPPAPQNPVATSPAAPVVTNAPPNASAYSLALGSVAIRCSGNTITLDIATPIAGASVKVENAGPEEVEVKFKRNGQEAKFAAKCRNGAPSVKTEAGDSNQTSDKDSEKESSSDDEENHS